MNKRSHGGKERENNKMEDVRGAKVGIELEIGYLDGGGCWISVSLFFYSIKIEDERAALV